MQNSNMKVLASRYFMLEKSPVELFVLINRSKDKFLANLCDDPILKNQFLDALALSTDSFQSFIVHQLDYSIENKHEYKSIIVTNKANSEKATEYIKQIFKNVCEEDVTIQKDIKFNSGLEAQTIIHPKFLKASIGDLLLDYVKDSELSYNKKYEGIYSNDALSVAYIEGKVFGYQNFVVIDGTTDSQSYIMFPERMKNDETDAYIKIIGNTGALENSISKLKGIIKDSKLEEIDWNTFSYRTGNWA